MARLTEMFGFEQRVFPLGDLVFRPLKDAINRWDSRIYGGYRAAGLSFQVLYELPGCRFVLFDYHCCEVCTVRRWWRDREIWVGSEPPKYREVTPDRAVEFLWDHHYELPKSLEHWPERMLREKASQPERPRPSPRPLSLWTGTNPMVRQNQTPPHDILEYVEELFNVGVPAIQIIRKWEHEMPPNDPFMVSVFMAMLLGTFKVDPATWKGSANSIPPESATLLELTWPPQTHPIRERIAELIARLDAPMALLLAGHPFGSPLQPTCDERSEARRTVFEALPEIELSLVSIRNQLTAIRQTQEQAAAEQSAKNAVPRPPEDAFLVHQIKNETGQKQEWVAEEFTRRTGKPMTQGQVSKMLSAVQEWNAANNEDPRSELPDPRKAKPSDPHMLDLGPRQDGQTPAQRGKCDSE